MSNLEGGAVLTSTATMVSVVSIDSALADRVQSDGVRGRVHSVFRRVVNVLTSDDRLISFASSRLDDAPMSARVDLPDWSLTTLRPHDRVEMTEQMAYFPARVDAPTLDLRGAQRWSASPVPLADLDHRALGTSVAALGKLIEVHGTPGGMLGPGPTASLFERTVSDKLRAGRRTLVRAITEGDDAGMRAGSTMLLGLGTGLTPAGDDFMTGLVLVSAQPGSAIADYRPALRNVIDEHPGRTTVHSRVMIREAVEGRARASILGLLRSIIASTNDRHDAVSLLVPVERVLHIGHTSGTDILSGLHTGLQLEHELRGRT